LEHWSVVATTKGGSRRRRRRRRRRKSKQPINISKRLLFLVVGKIVNRGNN